MVSLEIFAVVVVAIAMAMALAHLVELPGKMRLPKEQYLAVYAIYYPGFTISGASEAVSILVAALLAALTGSALLTSACVALAVMQAIYWIWIHPVDNFWIRSVSLRSAGRANFELGQGALPDTGFAEWTSLRDRWEYCHAARAILAVLAFVLLVVAVVGSNG
jgi:hypothetical protein